METDEEIARRREAAAKEEESGFEIEWKQLRKKKIGYILKMKFMGSEYRKMLAEMELKRRAFVRDVLIDRVLAASAISLIALFH